jgi:hypothetical protein
MIPRPAGTVGTNFSIQVEMGLSGMTKKYDKYKAIQVSLLQSISHEGLLTASNLQRNL